MEKILYNENGNIIKLIEKNNTKWVDVDEAFGYKVTNTSKMCPDYDYMLVVNSNIVWKGNFDEQLIANVVNGNLRIERKSDMLLPLIGISVSNLLEIKTEDEMNDYIKLYQSLKEPKDFEMMKGVYNIGKSGNLDDSWKYGGYNKTRALFDRLNDENSIEHQQFLINLIDPLINILIYKNKMVDCLDKLGTTVFEIRVKLKKHPEIITMLCLEYNIDINDLINYGEDSDIKIVQKM